MSIYNVQNQWGGSSAAWNQGGLWAIGGRSNQGVIALKAKSEDGGKTLTGTMTYSGEGEIGFRATLSGTNTYTVQNQWGGSSAPWQEGGTWILGSRKNQGVVAIDLTSNDGGKTLAGTMTYAGEGPIGFKGELRSGGAYTVQNQWGGASAPWQQGGAWLIGARDGQKVTAIKATSTDGGKTLTGSMTYSGEGAIAFKATQDGENTYTVQNQWGGSAAPWQPGGIWLIGARQSQGVVSLDVTSTDGGKTLAGTMTYAGEGPIGFRGTLN
ncbi:lectin OAA family protein [Melittangium boletus]|uniref:Lectin ESA-2 n=1 Tax=Melittangium boletus DSM 14713 TaxID=1294270 RepID=A0A250IRP0_9BACT|nr:lectin ESA-2 [Melittangium boletus]ATB33606.1 lectin ESA-2 [Melittangium boletus DSM 14713]